MDEIQKNLLLQVADLHEVPEGAYNIRSDGESAGRRTTENIDIVTKTDKNGIDIIIFEKEKSCTITYKDNLTEYTFLLECDFETAKEFAKTIK